MRNIRSLSSKIGCPHIHTRFFLKGTVTKIHMTQKTAGREGGHHTIETCTYLSFSRLTATLLTKIFFLKMYSIILDPNLDPNWAKIMDPDLNSMYLDPQHCLKVFKKASSSSTGALNSFVSVYCSLHNFFKYRCPSMS